MRPGPAAGCCLLLSLMLLAGGCGETEQISRYGVAKEAPTPTADRDEIQPFETQPASAWFFKLTGPAEAVASVADQFRSVVESTSIEGGEPSWTLPENWKQQPPSTMRFATLTIDETDPPLEVSVSQLPYPGGRERYLQDNINRWRGQVGLPASSDTDWLEQAEAAGEVTALSGKTEDTTLVDLTGQTADFPEARMLAAILLPAGSSGSTTTEPPT